MLVRSSMFAALVLGSVVAVACSSSSDTTADFRGSCNQLASRCHPVQTPLGKECHELGHAGDDAQCGPRREECLAECPEKSEEPSADAGSFEDAADAGSSDRDAAPSACAAYCTCMTATCADQPDYPYADEAACLSACAGFSAENLTCYADACEDANVAADKGHDCEHASGKVACH